MISEFLECPKCKKKRSGFIGRFGSFSYTVTCGICEAEMQHGFVSLEIDEKQPYLYIEPGTVSTQSQVDAWVKSFVKVMRTGKYS